MPECKMEGQRIPDVTFHIHTEKGLEEFKLAEAVKGKKVIIFSLPGAFTPTCSSSHLPRFDELGPAFKRAGIDDIYCASVNDAFVMDAWRKAHKVRNVKMLPDGNGEFAKAMGMLVDKSAIGFGMRSWRYSILAEDGVIKKVFVEPEAGADPYGVSDADTMLKHVDPECKPPHQIVVLTKDGCPFCAKAKAGLSAKGLRFEEIVLPDSNRSVVIGAMSGKKTVPQVWIDGDYIGDSEQLAKWLESH